MTNPISRLSMRNPWHLLATGFGSGLSPIIPGTMGTLASVPFYLLLAHLSFWPYVLWVLLACLIGVKICQVTSTDMQVHDHGSIVWDEFAGFWITMLIVPFLQLSVWDWRWPVTGFVLFRFFDMVKPWPIGWLDKRVEGGLGIMLDDIVAGMMSAIMLIIVGSWAGWLN
ncbi:phosphatidylglycerophosphatase A [Vibrio cincinnatiensis]|uniref:phosphatidylglycerophosphatase A n=1 Tax=Vibrio cincinnatiensis TaxID=675 RepID=UPI0012AC7035|nr:phosphatidylglycerophosphatase A [Vibrio cincinnatiensis]MCG3726103.1 phosphatidylglycerophosphatase A [Vibrio cincinnatiensis]MCG3736166.1 phosphatidylglycerophosphatase A [Vibrio cincinnatiensis]MCG3747041.1 phosphatidylglycerophosphatase A [Vibrio cincinnatiensis]MCG3758451.1 phosphatidylglycerophosphatase A [Vibrio cincinnatiensis]MCG3761687.1 phosphatidylglycerophosphatase A [Vibrio cincinnatiensis]